MALTRRKLQLRAERLDGSRCELATGSVFESASEIDLIRTEILLAGIGRSGSFSRCGDAPGVGGSGKAILRWCCDGRVADATVDCPSPKNGSFPLELPLVVGGILSSIARIPGIRVFA
jgi:hypothetical protein